MLSHTAAGGGSTMPTNEPLRRDLLEMARLDRVTRAELAASGELFDAGYEPRMARVHERNAQRLRRVIESVGWPGTDLVGSDGAEAAWTILQHAIAEPDLLRRALPLLETAARVRKGGISRRSPPTFTSPEKSPATGASTARPVAAADAGEQL